MNKYILKEIFSFIKMQTKLQLIKYNKNLMSKLDITKYIYQKYSFMYYLTPYLLLNPNLFIDGGIFDKETLDKLLDEWKQETTGKYNKKYMFNKVSDLEVYKILNAHKKSFNLKQNPKLKMLNLLELNLSNQNDKFEIPCSVLINLESLSLKNINKIKILTKDSNIYLNKLKNLSLSNVSFNKKQNIYFKMPNLEYLDIKFDIEKYEYQFDQEEDEDESISKYDIFYNVKKTYRNIKKIIDIFGFNFLTIFLYKKENDKNEDPTLIFQTIKNNAMKPEKFFQKKNIQKLNYLKFNITCKLDLGCGSSTDLLIFSSEYLFSKTKKDKYFFKTWFTSISDGDILNYNIIRKDFRYSNNRNYNDYYFRDKEIGISSWDDRSDEKINEDDLNLNAIKIIKDDDNYIDPKSCMFLFDKIKENNTQLELIYFDILEIGEKSKFINNIKKFSALKCFYVEEHCALNNRQIFALLKNLLSLKRIVRIFIAFQEKLILSENEKKQIYGLSPGISIKINENKSSIEWT